MTTDAELIAHHLATKGVTVVREGMAAGLSAMEVNTGITAPPWTQTIPLRDQISIHANAAKARFQAKRAAK